MRVMTIVVAALVAAAGCKKKDDAAKPATDDNKVADDKEAPKAAKPDPWAGPPKGADQKLGAKTGDGLSKVSASNVSGLAAKVDIKDIAAPTQQQAIKGFASVEATGFRVVYNPSQNEAHEKYRQLFAQQRVFETVAEGLNKTIRIPRTVDIETVDCNTVNAFYDPNTKRIIVCYELLDYFLDTFKAHATDANQLGSAVMGAVMFSFFHESGHGLINLLDLPAVGREEDSVDQLATLILIAGGDDGVSMALSGAYWFQLQSQSQGGAQQAKLPFWDEHGFDGQRFYNILCLIYGSNPAKYGDFVKSGNLPEARAQRCQEEYTKINKAWEKLLQPYLTNGAATNVSYQPTVPQTEAPKGTGTDPWGGQSGDSTVNQQPAPPPPPPAATHAITCEQVADKAIALIVAQAEEAAKTMTPEQIEALKGQLQTQGPAVMQQILAQCAKDNWSDASRKCVIDAPNLEVAGKCN